MTLKINKGVELMLRRSTKPTPKRKGFAFNPTIKIFRKKFYFKLELEWETNT